MDKWLEVDLSKLQQNLTQLRSLIQVPIMAVLKQDAYGLGAVPVGKFLAAQGVGYFGVTHIEEGVRLREAGINAPILIFAPSFYDEEDLEAVWHYGLTPSVYCLELAQKLNQTAIKLDKPVPVHIKIDTGMGRLGFTPAEMFDHAHWLQQLPGLYYEGIYTHYSNAFDSSGVDTKKQSQIFNQLLDRLATLGFKFDLRHSANSPAALKFPETHLDMVRIGSALLGNGVVNGKISLVRAYQFKVRVLQVRQLSSGSNVGYSNTYRVKKDTRVAVLPIGYTDGLGLQKKNDSFRLMDFLREQYHLLQSFTKRQHQIYYQGHPLPILGKISMHLVVVDIGALPIESGSVVDVQMSPLLAGDLAKVWVGHGEPVGAGVK